MQSWIHEMFMHSRTVSPQLEDNIEKNVDPKYFDTKHICHHAWKTVRTTFQYIFVLQWRGEVPEK